MILYFITLIAWAWIVIALMSFYLIVQHNMKWELFPLRQLKLAPNKLFAFILSVLWLVVYYTY